MTNTALQAHLKFSAFQHEIYVWKFLEETFFQTKQLQLFLSLLCFCVRILPKHLQKLLLKGKGINKPARACSQFFSKPRLCDGRQVLCDIFHQCRQEL